MANNTSLASLAELLSPYGRRAEQDLQRWLIEEGVPAELADAMRYCVLGGGKRLRPALVFLAAEAAGGADEDLAARSAVAIELVHCYSLVHDDLPAMDNDVLRRGMPTAHVKFGQAMAILAGDALLTRAFGVLAGGVDGRAARLAAELALAAGPAGMIAGQVADMNLCTVPGGGEGIEYIHLRKTAMMIRAAVRMGAICGSAGDDEIAAFGRYGQAVGLAFQLFDDLLDATASASELGKTPGKDAQAGKQTYVAHLGMDETRRLGRQLTQQAHDALAPLGGRGAKLRELADLLASRRS